jgi:hypothetical protein
VSAELRRQLLRMVLWVLVLHGAAIAVFYLADLRTASSGVRNAFTVVWMGLTFALVLVYLRRIRRIRKGGGPR